MRGLLLLVLLVVVGFSRRVDGIFSGEDTGDPGSNFVVDDRFVVFSYDVDTEFLPARSGFMRAWRVTLRRTTISSVFSSNGSDSRPSALSRSLLMNVPFELFTSLMKICEGMGEA